jgi:hypothetical protein
MSHCSQSKMIKTTHDSFITIKNGAALLSAYEKQL